MVHQKTNFSESWSETAITAEAIFAHQTYPNTVRSFQCVVESIFSSIFILGILRPLLLTQNTHRLVSNSMLKTGQNYGDSKMCTIKQTPLDFHRFIWFVSLYKRVFHRTTKFTGDLEQGIIVQVTRSGKEAFGTTRVDAEIPSRQHFPAVKINQNKCQHKQSSSARTQSRVRELLLVVQVRVSVQSYMTVVDALVPEGVAHPLAEHGGRHQRHDVLQSAGQFEHDHYERDGHSCHAACVAQKKVGDNLYDVRLRRGGS